MLRHMTAIRPHVPCPGRAVPESIRAFLPAGRSYLTLGTDGFGRSDTRAALRGFFGVDASSIVKAALHQLKAG